MVENAMVPTMPSAADYEFEFHPHSARFPLLEGEEFEALIHSIERQGLLNPITLYDGKVLDGRNRYSAAKAARYKFAAKDFVQLPAGYDPKEFVLIANVNRRHLTTEQKKTLVIQIMRERPYASDRQIAKLTGVDNKTVGNYRRELEKRATDFVEAWRDLDSVQRREFVTTHREELRQAGQ
jgi:ParB-like chromosome segregation protein Spo0J